MRSATLLFFLVTVLSLALSGCGPGPSPTATPVAPTPTSVPPTLTPASPTLTLALPTPTPTRATIIILSAADAGPGTLRQALLDAKHGDIITFDPKVFPPANPMIIALTSGLPEITQGNLTIDASNAGVILDGSKIEGPWTSGLTIRSNGNTFQGLQIINFPGSGINLGGGAQNNTIGGDRTIGSGPLGQGNLLSGNYVGIDLQENGTSFNIVIGNLIGTDVDGLAARGNRETNIYIANGASHNIIGPGNIIAYSTEGIKMESTVSLGNTITQNSIYGNLSGIKLNGSNAFLPPPAILGYDLSAGTTTIFACANCMVEIFSDDGTQGKTYEGQGVTNDEGIFTFDKGTSFTGPHLTATTTDIDGNTSGFSPPTLGTRKSSLLQEGNTLPVIGLQPKQSRELEDNGVGAHFSNLWHPEPEVFPNNWSLDGSNIFKLGLKRVRLAINDLDSYKVDWSKPEFSIDPSHDDFITSLADNGVTVTYVLSFWDKAYRAEGGEIPIPRFKTEDDVQRYLDYVQFIVHHFKDRVEYYEIWNEPNTTDKIQWIEVEDYINLVRRAVPVIRQEYPEAKIVVGGTTSLIDIESQTYLFRILRSDIMPLVDVVSWHPMYGSSPEYDFHRQYYYGYPSLVQEIIDVASVHGFAGEFVADEIHWNTPDLPEPPWPTYSETESAKYLARSIVMHRGMNIAVTQLLLYGKPQVFRANQDISTIMAGAEPTNLPVEIRSDATHIRSYSFSLPNGDKLIALWTDGVAVDDDPGVESTLIVPGFSAQKVMGIDVLNGFEQQVITSAEDGNLVIRDLLVKDYPIMLRFSDIASP
jgi:hypothetical protein